MRLRYNIYIYIYSFKQEGNDGKMMQLREEKVLFFSNQLFFFQIGNNYSINDAIEIGNIMYIYIYLYIFINFTVAKTSKMIWRTQKCSTGPVTKFPT